MAQFHAFDDLTDLSVGGGNHAVDNVDYKEGAGSVKVTTTAADWELETWTPAATQDWSSKTGVIFWHKASSARFIQINIWDNAGHNENWSWNADLVWTEKSLIFGTGGGAGTVDYAHVQKIQFWMWGNAIGQSFWLDDGRTLPLPVVAAARPQDLIHQKAPRQFIAMPRFKI